MVTKEGIFGPYNGLKKYNVGEGICRCHYGNRRSLYSNLRLKDKFLVLKVDERGGSGSQNGSRSQGSQD